MTTRPYHLTDLPEIAARGRDDLLSDVLGRIRLTGERVELVHLTAGASPERLGSACLFVVAAGEIVFEQGARSHVAHNGDLVLLPAGIPGGGVRAEQNAAEILLARFRFDTHSLHRMLLVLPDFVHVAEADGQPWLAGIASFLRIEALDDQPGAALMVSRLIDLAVIRALRTWAQVGHTRGWLGGLADPRIARALAALHANPLRRWRLEELAARAGMSRSSFCDRFAALIGKPPLRYHIELRLGMARLMLVDQEMRVGEAAHKVGYESDAAFSRAYKTMFGKSPKADR